MKKLSFIAATLLMMLGFVSCIENDNPAVNKKTVVYDGVKYEVDLCATFEAPQGTEVSFTLGSWSENGDVCGIDFGDGNIQAIKIGFQNQGPLKEDGTPGQLVAYKGKVAGDGIVKIYGHDDFWYANITGGVLPTTFNQSKLQNLVQLLITDANVEAFELPALPKLNSFSFRNSKATSVDVSQATTLTSLIVANTGITGIDLSALTNLEDLQLMQNKLAGVDVSKNTKLTYINVYGNELTALDLSANTALKNIWAQQNKLTSVTAPAGAALTSLNVYENEITALDLTGVKSIRDVKAYKNKLATLNLPAQENDFRDILVYDNELASLTLTKAARKIEAQNNKLTAVAIAGATSSLKLQNNLLTFSTLPALPEGLSASKYVYAPQNTVIPVTISGGAVDLKKEYGPFKGVAATDDNLSTITFNADGADMPAENFKVEEGIVNFLHVYNVVYGTLTNAAFPELTLTTSKFAIQFGKAVKYETLFTYDFAAEQALIAAGTVNKPGNVGGNQNNGQGFYGWEKADKTDSKRNDYKAYKLAAGSQLPAECHLWRRADRYDQDASWANAGGLTCPNDREYTIDGVDAGYLVEIFYDSADQILWAIGDGTSDNDGKVRATAFINGAEAVTGETTIPSGAGIVVKSVTPAVKGTGYIVFKVKKNMIISKVVISKPAE